MVPIPTFPLLSTVNLLVNPVSPPAEVLISKVEPLNTLIDLLLPVKPIFPEREASPVTSNLAVGIVVPIPIFPPVLKKESPLVVPASLIRAEAVALAVPPISTSSVMLVGERVPLYLCQN